MTRIVLCLLGLCLLLSNSVALAATPPAELNLRDFGAVGDGVTDDGPAFQKALDALGAAGGGTLFIPEGRYVIATPVTKNFTGLASSITITGVESTKALAPPTASGHELAEGLDLPSEIYPRTGDANRALTIVGLQTFVIKEIAFVGTPTARTDAEVTLAMVDIEKAQVKHCEFYGLSTLVDGGAIVAAVRSDLELTKSKFLGTTATSGGYLPVVQNLEWKGITVSDTTFLDYGLRPDFFSKTFLAAPISWINVGNAAQPTNHSPRREVVIRNVFLDEGGYWGLSSMPLRYIPQSATVDLIYVTGLVMNVSNFNQYGHHFTDVERVFVEKSRYGWSHNAAAAVNLVNVGTAILDQLTCIADADVIYADSNTRELTVINSTYGYLDSHAQTTNTINPESAADDPAQYVRARFTAVLGREVDPAAHFYWTDRLIRCSTDSQCQAATKEAFNNFLASSPSRTFTVSGFVTDEQGTPLAGLPVTVSGSQFVTTKTDAGGHYIFSNLPTSGRYVITPSKEDYTFVSINNTIITPSGDRTANFTSKLRTHVVKGSIKVDGNPLAGVMVTLSGDANATALTDSAGKYSFVVNTHGNFLLTLTKAHYWFSPSARSISDVRADTEIDFSATLETHSIRGRVLDSRGKPVAGVAITLSGSTSRSTITASDGSYSFANIDGGASGTVTASKTNQVLAPASQTFADLGADTVVDFSAAQLPILLTAVDSDRAIALELMTLVAEPFPFTTLMSGGDSRTRIIVFATDLGLLPGEGAEALTAEAEDSAGVRYALQVESINTVTQAPEITQIVLRLNDDLEDAGNVFLSITVHGLTSNKARIAIGHFGDGPRLAQ